MATYICYFDLVKRTTIFLPDAVHERLRQEAFSLNMSMAELIRLRVDRGSTATRRATPDPLAGVEGIVKDGNLSRSMDEALYRDRE